MVVCTLPHFSPLKLGSFAVLSKTFLLGKNRETIIVQNVFSLGNYAKPSQVKNQKHFFLGSVVKLLPIKNIISPGEIHIVLTTPTVPVLAISCVPSNPSHFKKKCVSHPTYWHSNRKKKQRDNRRIKRRLMKTGGSDQPGSSRDV